MKNFKRICSYFLYIFFISIIFFVSEIICNQWVKLELINSYNNTPYNKYSVYFIMYSSENNLDLSDIDEKNILSSFVLLKYNEDMLNMNEVIYCGENAVKINNLSIKEINFNNGEAFAIAGSDSGYNIGENVYNNGISYKVSGLLEKHISAVINSAVFYTNANLSNVSASYTYVLTSSKNKYTEEAFEA